MLRIYNFFSLLALIGYFPLLLFKKGSENKKIFLRERLGISHYEKADVWIHAVSVGEVSAVLPFLHELRKKFSKIKIVLSTTTYTGQKIAREKCIGADRIMYMPWDVSLSINKAVRYIRPKVFITVETELWPQLFSILKEMDAQVVVLNGRISPESFKGYKRIKLFIKQALSNIDYFYMQSGIDAERILQIGAEHKKISTMGNFKFDIAFEKRGTARWLDSVETRIVLAGSTHKGEEEIILDAFEAIKSRGTELKLLLAPRHPERFHEVEDLLKKRNVTYCRRSKISTPDPRQNNKGQETAYRAENIQTINEADIILLDTIGELSELFSKGDIAFIGGSLLSYGGHNILEPAYWGKPILFGPHMDNFPFAEDFIKEGAALMVKDSRDIAEAVENLLHNTEKAKQMGQRAKAIIKRNTGAVKKALHLVENLLGHTE
jgi:3-deoxy-D-manno-octulosonic-acid transferase